MPTPVNPFPRGRRAAYSVVEVAKLCRLSRARFYDLIGGDNPVMPPPVYDIKTRRPFYTVELAARCVEIRDTNLGFDGRFVMFYEQRPTAVIATITPPQSSTARPRRAPIDPLTQEMFEALRDTGIHVPEAEMIEAIGRCCPSGLTEGRFDLDLLLIRSQLQRPRGV